MKKPTLYYCLYITLCVCAVIAVSCTRTPPVAPGATTPAVTILPQGLTRQDDTLKTDSLVIVLQGDLDISLFRYRLDNSGWITEFSKIDTITLKFLDDGRHTFEVQTKHEGWTETVTATFSFVVSAIDSVALYLYPRCYTLFSSKDSVQFEVKSKGLGPSDRLHLVFSGGTLGSVRAGKDLDEGSVLLFVSDSIIDLLLVPGSPMIQDSMSLLSLIVLPGSDADTCFFNFDPLASTVRDSLNEALPVAQYRGGAIIR